MRSATLLGFIAFSLSAILAACAPSVPGTEAPTAVGAPPSPSVMPSSTAVPLSFTPATYKDESNGFELQYPTGWTAVPPAVIGPRGSQAQLRGPGVTDQALPAGSSRVSVNVNLWEPKHDLAAYVTQRKTAWDGGGSKIISESSGDLSDGRKYMSFVVQAPDGVQAFFLFTELGEKYLEIAGEGDLKLVEEIAHTFRPLGQ